MPSLASAHEQGLGGFEAPTWFAVFLPRGASEPIIRKLNQAAFATADTPSVQERLNVLAATAAAPERRSPEYLARFVSSQIDKWAVPIKAAGILVEWGHRPSHPL